MRINLSKMRDLGYEVSLLQHDGAEYLCIHGTGPEKANLPEYVHEFLRIVGKDWSLSDRDNDQFMTDILQFREQRDLKNCYM